MLELRNITAGYGPHTVLRDVSLVVPSDGVVALLGANGAGKTTLLRVASGILRPFAGQVLIDGVDMTEAAPHEYAAAGICHVPEGRGVFPSLTVADNLRLQAPRHRLAGIEGALHAFPRLAERYGQRAGTMSGGEQRMLALAHAYVAEPKIVLLDEVSMGLAPKIVEEIFGYLRDLAARGCGLLLVEQYVHQTLALADYVYVMAKGSIEFVGEPSEIGDDVVASSYLGSNVGSTS